MGSILSIKSTSPTTRYDNRIYANQVICIYLHDSVQWFHELTSHYGLVFLNFFQTTPTSINIAYRGRKRLRIQNTYLDRLKSMKNYCVVKRFAITIQYSASTLNFSLGDHIVHEQ